MQPGNDHPPIPDSRKVAFKQGLIFGPILAVIALVLYLVSALLSITALKGSSSITSLSTANPLASVTASLLVFLIFIVGCLINLWAGARASSQTARVSTGTIAGLWTGAIYGVIEFIGKLFIFFLLTYPAEKNIYNSISNGLNSSTFVIIGAIVGLVFGMAFAIGVGAGFGALGGLIGRSRGRKKLGLPPLYMEQMYTSPYGQPPAPGYYNQPPYGQPPVSGYYNQPPVGQPYPQPVNMPPQPAQPQGDPSLPYDDPRHYQAAASVPPAAPAPQPASQPDEWKSYEHASEPQYMESATSTTSDQPPIAADSTAVSSDEPTQRADEPDAAAAPTEQKSSSEDATEEQQP